VSIPSEYNRPYRAVTLVVGHRYQVSGKFYPVGGVSLLYMEDSNGNVVGIDTTLPISGNAGFVELKFDFVATVTGHTLYFGGLHNYDAMYVDDFKVCEVT
jgi:hypothetical protein